MNAIGLAVADASAIRTHLFVHGDGTAHPMSAAFARPRSAADCLIRSAVAAVCCRVSQTSSGHWTYPMSGHRINPIVLNRIWILTFVHEWTWKIQNLLLMHKTSYFGRDGFLLVAMD